MPVNPTAKGTSLKDPAVTRWSAAVASGIPPKSDNRRDMKERRLALRLIYFSFLLDMGFVTMRELNKEEIDQMTGGEGCEHAGDSYSEGAIIEGSRGQDMICRDGDRYPYEEK